MPLISTSVSNFVNGVSQQADSLRFPSQCDEQINALSSVIDGLTKRPPLNHIKKLFSPLGVAFFHAINRDSSERYEVVVSGGTSPVVTVFDLGGTSYPVKNKDGGALTLSDAAYLATATPHSSLKALTVADYTLFLNRDKTVALKADLVPTSPPAALLFVKQFRAGMKVTLKLYDSPSNTSPDYEWSLEGDPKVTANADYTFTGTGTGIGSPLTYACVDQGDIVGALADLLNNGGADSVYSWFLEDSQLFIQRDDETDFRVEITCTVPESAYVFKDEVQNFNLLPKRSWVGFQIRVQGDPEESGDDYYIQYVSSTEGGTGFANGFWEESQKPGITYKLDPDTLPHALVSFGSYFVFKPLEWGDRTCGDADTNPDPSFIGQTIRNLFFWKNRLGFLSGENVIMSEASSFFNFWRTTVITLLDADPIDVGVSHTRISLLNSAVPNSERLILTSDQTQFTLQGGDLLTPKTVSVTQTTDYENLKDVEPLSLGNSVFLAFNRGQYSGLLEYCIQSDTGLYSGFDISSHVPRYIAGNVTKLVGSETEGIIIATTDDFPTGVFVYRYYTKGGQKLLSAWFKFDFGTGVTVRDVFLINTRGYFVLDRADGTFLESLDISPGLRDDDSDYTIFLDRRIPEGSLVSRTYDSVTNETALVLPYTPSEDIQVTTRETSSARGGFRLRVMSVSGDTVKVRGNYSATSLWIGEPYTMRYVMTKPTLRSSDGQGSYIINPGRFQVRRGLLSFDNTLFFKVVVTPLYRSSYTYTYENRDVNVGNIVIDQPTTQKDGTFSFPVLSKNDQVSIEIINDSPYPSNLLGVDWEALYTVRSLRQ
jgi:hypothetical protein